MRLAWVLVLGLAAHAAAFSFEPPPLWNLTSDAPVIVVAHVAAVEPETSKGTGVVATARLEIAQVLKGSAEKTVKVTYGSCWGCPPPARFLVGQDMVAFLSREAGDGTYGALAFSSGTRYADSPGDLDKLRAVIELAVEAHASGAPDAMRRWAIEAYKRRVTRADGLFSLEPDFREFHLYDSRGAALAKLLSKDELAQLEAAFIAEPSFDETLAESLAMFDGNPSAQLTSVAVEVIDALVAANRRRLWLDEAMLMTRARLERRRYRAPGADALKGPAVDKRIDTLEARWLALKRRFKLAPQPRSDFVSAQNE